MSNVIGPADLIKFHSGLKISDIKNWKPVPASAVVQPTAEMKAEMAAHEARARQVQEDSDAQVAAGRSPKAMRF